MFGHLSVDAFRQGLKPRDFRGLIGTAKAVP